MADRKPLSELVKSRELQTIPVRVETGAVVEVPVCWDAEQCKAAASQYKDGITPGDPAQMKTDASDAEKHWLATKARMIAGLPVVVPVAAPEGEAGAARAKPAVGAPRFAELAKVSAALTAEQARKLEQPAPRRFVRRT